MVLGASTGRRDSEPRDADSDSAAATAGGGEFDQEADTPRSDTSHMAHSPFASNSSLLLQQQHQQHQPGGTAAICGTSVSDVSREDGGTAGFDLHSLPGPQPPLQQLLPSPTPSSLAATAAASRAASVASQQSAGGAGVGSGAHQLHRVSGRSQGGLFAGRQAATPSEAGSSGSNITLESLMSQLHQGGSHGARECRVLLPGLDLLEHGLHNLDMQAKGGDLQVVTAPRGVDLRMAISQALSMQLETTSSVLGCGPGTAASASQQQQQHSMPGTPATLPCGLASAAGTPVTSFRLAGTPLAGSQLAPDEQQQQQQQQQVGAWHWAPGMPSPRVMHPGSGGSQVHTLAPMLGPGGASRALSGALTPRPHLQAAEGAWAQAEGPAAEEQGEWCRAITLDQQEFVPPEAPVLRLAPSRPWSHDGTGSAANLATMRAERPSPIDITYRARAAARMWPMLAPFVPRMLRRYILQSHPPPGSLGDQGSPVYDSLGKALASKAAAPPQSLSRVMRPCMDSFPAAVLVADVSGFTALTEVLGARGSAGVELLTKCMNRYFTQVIDLLLLYGGDVEKFAGDCMIVVFAATQSEATGLHDGGLRAATLRAVACGAELSKSFGAMRMLPNGEVVPIPLAERWVAEAEATSPVFGGSGGGEEGQGRIFQQFDLLKDMLGAAPNLLVRPGGIALSAAQGGAKVAATVAGGGARRASSAAGTGARAAGAVAGMGARKAGSVAGSSAKLAATAFGKAGSAGRRRLHSASTSLLPAQRSGSGQMQLPSAFVAGAASSGGGAVEPGSPDFSRGSSGAVLQRSSSSPDAHMLADMSAALAADARREGAARKLLPLSQVSPVRSIVRQSGSLAAAVVSRLSRSSSPAGVPGGRGDSRQHSAAAAAEGQQRGASPGTLLNPDPALDDLATAAARDASEARQQRERRLHEQALAELVVLAGPASALRPPELPSAATHAEAAEQRLAEQVALYRRSSTPHSRLTKTTSAAAAGMQHVVRTTTAPPEVGGLLSSMAAEQQRQADELAGHFGGSTEGLGGGAGGEVQQRRVLLLESVPSGSALDLEREAAAAAAGGAGVGEVRSSGTGGSGNGRGGSGVCSQDLETNLSATSAAAAQLSMNDSALQPNSHGSREWDATAIGDGGTDATALPPPPQRRRSVVSRLLSAAAAPWRGRSVSSAQEMMRGGQVADGGSAGDCQLSNVSGASTAPWTASLAELSTGLGLPESSSSPRKSSVSAVSRLGHTSLDARRSHNTRRPGGGLSAAALMVHGSGYSQAPRPSRQGQGDTLAAAPSPSLPSLPSAAGNAAEAASHSPREPGGGAGGGQLAPPGQGTGPQVVLSLKVMVTAGTVCAFHVGGGQEAALDDVAGLPRWEFFIGDPPQPQQQRGGEGAEQQAVARPPIAQLRETEQYAISGETVLSHEVAALVGDSCVLEALGGGTSRLLQLLEPYQLPPEAQDEADNSTSLERAAKQIARERGALGALPEVAQGHALQLMRMHLLENVRVRVEAGHIDYVNELRVGTVLFLGFPSLLQPPPVAGPGSARTGLGAVQACMEVVQKRMRQHDGSFLQFRCDEKGFLAICAFGLPGRSHEDGPARGIQAALSIVEAVRRRGGRACCGVTTGQLFCAMVGSQRRSEYTVFGNAINLSARLMVRARDQAADVYCDSTTQQLAKNKALYCLLDPVRFKGRQHPIDVYQVASLDSDSAVVTAGGGGSGKQRGQSPLGAQLPAPPPPVAEAAAAAAAAAGLSASRSACEGSGFVPPPLPQQQAERPSGMLSSPRNSVGALESMASALAPQLLQLELMSEERGAAEQQVGGAGGQAGSQVPLSLEERLDFVASTAAAAPATLTPDTPMIARDGELALITDRCVRLVQQAQGGVMLVEGEAGMGKSRLVEELQQSELGGVYDGCNLFLGMGRRERKSQALYPWRRVLREMCHHDRQLGQVYCLKDTEPVVVVTELSLRLQESVADYAQWRHMLADALELPLSELPSAPTQHSRLVQQHPQDSITMGGSPMHREVAEVARQLALTVPASLDGGPVVHPARLGEAEQAFLSEGHRARSFASRMKRSASMTLGLLGKRRLDGTDTQQVQGGDDSQAPAAGSRERLRRGSGTPSPRKAERLRREQEAAVLQQVQATLGQAAAALRAPQHQDSGSSSEGSEREQYSASESASYCSSPASSFTAGSRGVMSPRTGGPHVGRDCGPLPCDNGGAGSLGRLQQWPMQRSATSRAAGGLTLKSSNASPGREISTHLRARKVQELVVEVIRQFTAAYGPLVLVLEDLHHFDTASWRLLTAATGDQGLRRSVLFILTYRPNFGALSPALRQRPGGRELRYQRVQAAHRTLLAQPNVLHLVLRPFNVDQSCAFVSAALGGAQVPPEVARLLWERSNGLPSFLEQLVVFLQLFVHTQLQTAAAPQDSMLRPGRRSTVEEVQAVAQAGLDFIRNNVSINSIITDRVDRLRPEEQLTLKVASVLGLTLYRQLLQAAHPQHPPASAIEASLCSLEAAAFLRQDPLDPSTWRFCQVLARDVVYEMVPKELRRDWHAAAAAAMEAYSSDQFALPPSTIAWHWSQSCRGEEAPQWQRSFRAVHWWEASASAALDNGDYAEALPLLQRAQDVAAALEAYFQGHSRSFMLMRHQSLMASGGSGEVAAPNAAGTIPAMYGSVLLAGTPTGLTGDTAASTRGSAPLAVPADSAASELAGLLPLVPRLRRAHWERCMAAMCIAAELTAESLHEAKAHCLRALHLLEVPLPSSEEFLAWRAAHQRWWHSQWPAVSMPTCTCLTGGAVDPLRLRAAELEAGAYAWMARPDAELAGGGGDTSGRLSLLKQQAASPTASQAAAQAASARAHVQARPGAGAAGPDSLAARGFGGRSFQSVAGGGGGRGSSASLESWQAPGSISLPPPAAQLQPLQPLPEGVQLGVPAPNSLSLFPSPFAVTAAAPGLGPALAGRPGEGSAAQAASRGGSASSSLAAAAAAAAVAAGNSRSSFGNAGGSSKRGSSFATRAGSAGAASWHLKPPLAPRPPSAELATAGTVGTAGSAQRRQSEGYRQWQAVGLAAAQVVAGAQQQPDQHQHTQPQHTQNQHIQHQHTQHQHTQHQHTQHQQHQPSSARFPRGAAPGDSDSLHVLPAHSDQADLLHHEQQVQVALRGQQTVTQQAVAFGLAGGGERYSARSKAEAGVVLDLLCTLLLCEAQPDGEGLHYLLWACRHLQGGRVKPFSPYASICADARAALRRSKQRGAGLRSSQAWDRQQAQQEPGLAGSGGAPPPARGSLPTLASMARAVASVLPVLSSRSSAADGQLDAAQQ